MLTIKQVFFVLLGVNCLFLMVFFNNVSSPEVLTPVTNALTQDQEVTRHTKDDSDSKDNDKINVIDDQDSKKDEKDDESDDIREKVRARRPKRDTKRPEHSRKTKKSRKDDSDEPKTLTFKEQARKTRLHLRKVKKQLLKAKSELDESNERVTNLMDRNSKVAHVLRWSNPFFLLGAYPRIGNEYFNSYPDGRPYYHRYNYGLINDDDYCEIVDFYNLAHPENMFESKNFFTDYSRTGLTRSNVIRKIGVDTMRQISRYMEREDFRSYQYHLTPIITNYFTKRVDLHIYHTIGKHFNCATQMYNHIPGHGVLKRKDLIVDSVDSYAARFENGRENCFNKKTFFPYSYRLYIQEECQAFFKHINSKEYLKSLQKEPIQFVIKLGYGAHRAKGVFIFDANETEYWKGVYENGEKCGYENKSIIAQTYITNPLLLDKENKFDFRVYMLVASTNPLIVYYHDGFLRVSLQGYDKNSSDKSVHLTNTHLSKEMFEKAEAENTTINGMTAQELRDYQMWTFQRLGDYLYEAGKVNDKNWVENTLKPQFYEAFIHTARMSAHAFWNQSNVYEMYGLDFMLDDDLNLWFIECNSSPQLIGTNEYKTKFLEQMLQDLFEIQYGLYRSRMKRTLALIKRIHQESSEAGLADYSNWRAEYAEAAKNRFEPEYEVNKGNSFKLIMDMNKNGKDAFFGHLDDECTV